MVLYPCRIPGCTSMMRNEPPKMSIDPVTNYVRFRNFLAHLENYHTDCLQESHRIDIKRIKKTATLLDHYPTTPTILSYSRNSTAVKPKVQRVNEKILMVLVKYYKKVFCSSRLTTGDW